MEKEGVGNLLVNQVSDTGSSQFIMILQLCWVRVVIY